MTRPRRHDFDAEAARQAREARALTQTELARQLEVGVATVNSWERGRRTPSDSVIGRLAEALGVEVGELRPTMPTLDKADLATVRRSWRISIGEAAAALGVTERHVQRIESGERLPNDPEAWARVYHLTLPELAAAWRRGAGDP